MLVKIDLNIREKWTRRIGMLYLMALTVQSMLKIYPIRVFSPLKSANLYLKELETTLSKNEMWLWQGEMLHRNCLHSKTAWKQMPIKFETFLIQNKLLVRDKKCTLRVKESQRKFSPNAMKQPNSLKKAI